MVRISSLYLIILAAFVCLFAACRTNQPLVQKASDYDYNYTVNDIEYIISFFTQDSSYFPKCDFNCIAFSPDSLVLQNSQERKCFHKNGFNIYKLSIYPETYTKYCYSYSCKITDLYNIVNGEVMSRGIINNDTMIIQMYKIMDPFW